MRIVVLTDDHPPLVGGVAVFTARVCAELARQGHEVRVFCRWRPELAAIPGTRVTPVLGPRFSRFGGRWLAWRARSALFRADAVLATTWPAATGLPALGVPFAVVAHGSDVTRPARDPRAFDRVWGAAADRLAMSRFLAGFVDARVLPAPVPLGPPRTGPGSGWAYVARATPLKGGDRFVRWVAAAGEQGHIVGHGPELPRWKAIAKQLGADIHFHGALTPDRLLPVVSARSLVALTPRVDADGTGAEGFGLCLVEAAALGVPVVGSRVGGVPDAVGPGLLVDDPDDVPAAIAQIARYLQTDPGPSGRAWAARVHGVGRTVSAWLGGSSSE